ncbi:MAG: protein SCO1/2 [Methanobacteriota archaeon]|jgi:protein SCO1/2|uniref:SCO family protein n=1 Tax=Halorutilus salinus TaxID=2487751 RepID=A0A9Q4C382_9EURY|nr:SCO family protein [Halorutilus salinus]MCX2818282.1 SCO family protein [Halorutilus salinus]
MKRRDCLRLAATGVGFSAAGCVSALRGGDDADENAYLEPPDDIHEDGGYPTYGDPVPDVDLLDIFTDEYVSTRQEGEYLMTFFYSFCPTECIWIISALTHTEARVVENGGEPPRILAATFDPARDTPKRLTDYAERMGIETDGGWSFLRPEDEKRADEVITGRFGVSFAKRSTGGIYDFLHDTLILLVNEDGYVERTYTNEEPNPDVIASDIADLRDAQA